MTTRLRHLSAAVAAALVAAGCGAPVDPNGAANGIAVGIDPSRAEVLPRGTVSFLAQVTGTVSTGVVWSVVETGGGTVDTTGKYVAPSGTGTFHVQAASVADPTRLASATVVVTISLLMSILS